MIDYQEKFGIKAEEVKPKFSTLPIERISSIDYEKLFETKLQE